MHRFSATVSAILLTLGLAACSGGQGGHAASNQASPETGWAASAGSKVDRALDEAAKELATKDITLPGHDVSGTTLPEAKITPQGDLVIEGQQVALTPAQHAAVLAYRRQLVAVAQQGMVVGGEGAKLGITAAGDAIAAIFSGKSAAQVRQRVEARAAGIKAGAAKLCSDLPALRDAQQKLAVEVPAFAPYATLTQEDIRNCRTDGAHIGGDGG